MRRRHLADESFSYSEKALLCRIASQPQTCRDLKWREGVCWFLRVKCGAHACSESDCSTTRSLGGQIERRNCAAGKKQFRPNLSKGSASLFSVEQYGWRICPVPRLASPSFREPEALSRFAWNSQVCPPGSKHRVRWNCCK